MYLTIGKRVFAEVKTDEMTKEELEEVFDHREVSVETGEGLTPRGGAPKDVLEKLEQLKAELGDDKVKTSSSV